MRDAGPAVSSFADPPWRHRRFAPYAQLVTRLAALPAWPTIAELDALLADHLRAVEPSVRLVEQPPSPPRRRRAPVDAAGLYELRIADAREVPSRAGNLHDLCNALVWAVFPRAKWALSVRLAALQRARAVGATRLPGARTVVHDRLALLDEGGLLLVGTPPVAMVFGHAILEHVVRGELAVRAAPFVLATSTPATVDVDLAAALTAGAEVTPGPGIVIDDAQLLR